MAEFFKTVDWKTVGISVAVVFLLLIVLGRRS